ncbi:multidrug efflux SMR transporter [Rhodococcus sp. HNM0569]|uniref:DMT family transporter n=1 Tax=Rhodococcus sp. HNM0569 TaxID=2716340 RepID=UPI00146F36A2|nr:multidrug efflux SMR transporter [Rhodococcus sp. HNM0569]NLU83641.1 multidrug efflux SMR transporter [Rhodococcus sp. HNM0569]
MSWVFLIGAILFEVSGTLAMRASEGFRKKAWVAPVAVSYLVAFACLAASLGQGMPVGIAYGIWAAAGVALTAVLARILFRDPLTWVMGLGIVVIMAGVLVIETAAQH